jgi:hypothetical protein
MKVYVLHHSHILEEDDIEDVKLIGVYSTEEAARAAVVRLDAMPGFSETPKLLTEDDEPREGFEITPYDLDEDGWTEGFVTLRDD